MKKHIYQIEITTGDYWVTPITVLDILTFLSEKTYKATINRVEVKKVRSKR